jgi:hypothetical protein
MRHDTWRRIDEGSVNLNKVSPKCFLRMHTSLFDILVPHRKQSLPLTMSQFPELKLESSAEKWIFFFFSEIVRSFSNSNFGSSPTANT